MDNPKYHIAIIAIVLLVTGLGGLFLPGSNTQARPTGQDAPTPTSMATPVTGVSLPNRWKLNKDTAGACQVAAPPEWKLGVDFFLDAEKIDPGPFENAPGQFPQVGRALWGTGDATQLPEGHQFQIRTSLVSSGLVCSVWRVKAEADFTDAEKAEMEQVGKTLQEVK
jgi:hypothetical protein